MLTLQEPPPEQWARSLDGALGATDWRQAFYAPASQHSLFGDSHEQRTATVEAVGQYFLARLRTAFVDVAPNPLTLTNSNGTPLYLLCFAAANKKGAPIALKIAKSILK